MKLISYIIGYRFTINVERMEYDISSQTLTCTSSGSPATTVTWRMNGEVIHDDRVRFEKTKILNNSLNAEYLNRLKFLTSDFNIAGITCQVSNSLSSSQNYPITTAGN